MFKPHIGDCIECPRRGVIIPVKSGLCQYCNHDRKIKSKAVSTRNVGGYVEGGEECDNDEGSRPESNIHSGSRKNSNRNSGEKTNASGLRRCLRSKTTFGREQQKDGRDFEIDDTENSIEYNLDGSLKLRDGRSHQLGRPSRKVGKKTKSPIRKARKPILGTKKGTGQAEIFEEISQEREWICYVSGLWLRELTATQFAHVLPKALNKYPLFKLYKKNIVLLSNEMHHLWDHTPRSELRKDRRFDKLFALEEELKQEYILLKSKA